MNVMTGTGMPTKIMNKEGTIMFELVKMKDCHMFRVLIMNKHKLYPMHGPIGGFVKSPDCICPNSYISRNVFINSEDVRLKDSIILSTAEFNISGGAIIENCNISTNSGYISTSKVSNLNCSNSNELKIWMGCDLKGSYDIVNASYVDISNTGADCNLVTTMDFYKLTFSECKLSGRIIVSRKSLELEKCNVVGPYNFNESGDGFEIGKVIIAE